MKNEKLPPIKETALVRACISYLLLKGHYVWRNNSAVTRLKYVNKYGQASERILRSGLKGSSDILGISTQGRFLAVECKVKPNKPTEMQEAFLLEIARRGGISIVAYDIDDLEKAGL